jgi:hypothetical protein
MFQLSQYSTRANERTDYATCQGTKRFEGKAYPNFRIHNVQIVTQRPCKFLGVTIKVAYILETKGGCELLRQHISIMQTRINRNIHTHNNWSLITVLFTQRSICRFTIRIKRTPMIWDKDDEEQRQFVAAIRQRSKGNLEKHNLLLELHLLALVGAELGQLSLFFENNITSPL